MRHLRKLTTACLPIALIGLLAATRLAAQSADTNTFIVAAYNVENWLSMDRHGKADQPKPQSEKDALFQVVAQIRPDVLGVEEMGTTNDLADLADGLRAHGIDLPYREWIQGADTNRHVSVLSRFPIVERFSRTDYNYLLNGKPQRIERGIIDVKIQVNDHYAFRAVVAHLKSKRHVEIGDQTVMRLEEAKLLRAHVGKALKDDPELNLIVMGDFNDTPESAPIRAIVGEPPFALVELLAVDSKGGQDTYYWKYRNQFSRIDYLITSPGMANEYVPDGARIADVEGWDNASDHRAVYAKFYAHEIVRAASPPARSTQSRGLLVVACLVFGAGSVVMVTGPGVSRRRQWPRA
ncbi:MAG TPA: endonuclease/exonuclease/phosphatase family protein [Verrucomicrobiae bacterium]|nr:endonuclease/exonuclease/phosphatase family protein [Verrucomicrobiae bacterium]